MASQTDRFQVSPPAGTVRQNPKGIVQKGKNLGGVNEMLSKIAGVTMRDTAGMYSSEALPTTPQGSQQQGHQTAPPMSDDWEYGNLPGEDDSGDANDGGGSLPILNPSDPIHKQNGSVAGTLPKKSGGGADVSDESRSIGPKLRGAVFRGLEDDERFSNFGAEEPDDADLISPMYANPNRNAFRANFLNTNLDSASALRAAEASQGYVQSGAETYEMRDGELVQVDPSKAREYRRLKASGQDPAQTFKDGYLKKVLDEVSGKKTSDDEYGNAEGEDDSGDANDGGGSLPDNSPATPAPADNGGFGDGSGAYEGDFPFDRPEQIDLTFAGGTKKMSDMTEEDWAKITK